MCASLLGALGQTFVKIEYLSIMRRFREKSAVNLATNGNLTQLD